MGHAARRLSQAIFQRPELTVIEGNKDQNQVVDHANFYSVLTIACVLIALQLLDGILTAIGMYQFGIGAEGNPLLKALMMQIGYANALIITKLVAIGIILVLSRCALKMDWVKKAMKVVAALYIVAAIIPWTYIIAIKSLVG